MKKRVLEIVLITIMALFIQKDNNGNGQLKTVRRREVRPAPIAPPRPQSDTDGYEFSFPVNGLLISEVCGMSMRYEV